MTSPQFDVNQKANKINQLSIKLNEAETIQNNSSIIEAEKKRKKETEIKLKDREKALKTDGEKLTKYEENVRALRALLTIVKAKLQNQKD